MKPIKLYYFNTWNFGDALSGKLVEAMSGRQVDCVGPLGAELAAAGSILKTDFLVREKVPLASMQGAKNLRRLCQDFFSPVLRIWGTGFLAPKPVSNPVVFRKCEVLAVRGKLTHQVLVRYGVISPYGKMAYGDPGLLYPLLIPCRPEVSCEVGLVPHEDDYLAGKFIEGRLNAAGITTRFIDVHASDPLSVLVDIASCETILSSSLHGCVVADALGIPNRMMLLSYFGRRPETHLFKYKDYYSGFGMDLNPVLLEDVVDRTLDMVKSIKRLYRISKDRVEEIKRGLLATFPFEIDNVVKGRL